MSAPLAIAPQQGQIVSFAETQQLSRVFYQSGFFRDLQNEAQAIVKVMAGRELGIEPFAAIDGIHIIQGKPSVGAGLMASRVKSSLKYDYQVLTHTPDICEIEFLERKEGEWVSLGVSTFTIEDARKAGTQNIQKFARNMLFARAMSNGVAWYCPDVFSTRVYIPEELGATVDGEGVPIPSANATVKTDASEEEPEVVDERPALVNDYNRTVQTICKYAHEDWPPVNAKMKLEVLNKAVKKAKDRLQDYIDEERAEVVENRQRPTLSDAIRDKVEASKADTEGIEAFAGGPDGVQREPVEVVIPEKVRKVSKRLMAVITEKGLSMAPEDKVERLRACNQYLLPSNVQIKSFKDLEPSMAAHLAVGIQDEVVTWAKVAVEGEVVG